MRWCFLKTINKRPHNIIESRDITFVSHTNRSICSATLSLKWESADFVNINTFQKDTSVVMRVKAQAQGKVILCTSIFYKVSLCLTIVKAHRSISQ